MFSAKNILNHSTFWLFYLILFILFNAEAFGYHTAFFVGFFNVCCQVIVVYFNLLYLIPRFLKQKKYLLYLLIILSFGLLLSYVNSILLYIYFFESPGIREYYISDGVLGLVGGIFTLTAISTAVYFVNQWIANQQKTKILENQRLQMELKFLKAQINPHFLFNTLNGIYALALKKDDQTPKTILKLSEMLRYQLYEGKESRVLLRKEVHYLENYIDLQKIRIGGRAQIEMTVDESLLDNIQIEPMLLQPFVENSFKHGLNKQANNSFLNIEIAKNGKKLVFSIQNSFPENQMEEKSKKTGGIGIENVKRRLELSYPKDHELQILKENKQFIVTLKINLEEK